MSGRIIEITTPGRSLHKERGFMAVREDGQTIGRIPLDDIDAVIAATHGLNWSGNILAALAERSVPVVFMGQNFTPIAHILPLAAHHNQGAIMQAQADSTLPMRKRLWAQIIKAKIEAQAEILSLISQSNQRLIKLKSEVKAGDPTGREAAAAQYYWPLLMGEKFRRNHGADDANALFNYGYTVLRAATARAIVAAGLNPSLSLHHVSDGQALRLADDLMEPFRPAVDITVFDLVKSGQTDITKEVKASLVAVLQVDYLTQNGNTPLSHVLVRLAQSLARVYQREDRALKLPKPMRPLADQLPLEMS
jgi:CRISPR-associated protein Cas1